MKYYLAIDIGASSGRHIVGWRKGETLETKEVYRFPNGVKEENGHLTWDLDRLLREVRAGIDAALDQFGSIESLSIDTWGGWTMCSCGVRRGSCPPMPTGTAGSIRSSRRSTERCLFQSCTAAPAASSSLLTPSISCMTIRKRAGWRGSQTSS